MEIPVRCGTVLPFILRSPCSFTGNRIGCRFLMVGWIGSRVSF
jgi:hypothetical protein